MGRRKLFREIPGLLIDKADARLLNTHSWRIKVGRRSNYVTSIADKKRIYLHRLIMSAHSDVQVDHINGNGLDNRRSNLRLASIQQNACNRGKQRNNTSGFKGVYWDKACLRWSARIRIDQRLKFLGYFNDKMKAAEVYNVAALLYQEDFAKLNSVEASA